MRHEIVQMSRKGMLCSCTWGIELVADADGPSRCRKYIYGTLMKEYREHRAEVLQIGAARGHGAGE